MFDDIREESFIEEIIQGMTLFDTKKDSFAHKLSEQLAAQIVKFRQALLNQIPVAFIDETSGEYIDKRAEEVNLPRKSGTKARTTLQFIGDDGLLIKASENLFETEDGLQYQLEEDVTLAGGTGIGTALAVEEGKEYNVGAGSITVQHINLGELREVINITEAVGGSDRESDAALTERLYEYWRNPATSGNAYHYKIWARQVEGVGEAKIFPLSEGPGSVAIVLVDTEGLPASDEIIEACRKHIEEEKPLGANVAVKSAELLPIQLKVHIRLEEEIGFEETEEEIRRVVSEHIRANAFKTDSLNYNYLAYLILGVPGVKDYSLFELNGSEQNITVSPYQVMAVSEIEVLRVGDGE